MHALPQRKQIAVHRNLHDGLSVDLNDKTPALLLHRDLRREAQSRLKGVPSADAVASDSVPSNLSPLAVVDRGSAAGHPADCAVLELQLQLPMVHCQHNP